MADEPEHTPPPAGANAEAEAAAPMGPLTLIGTGHVFDIEETVREAIIAMRPGAVFVELDRGRFVALMRRRQGIEDPPAQGAGTWVQRRLQRFQERMAAEYGTEAGAEMLAAVEGAHRIGARVGLVDRPIQITIQRVTKRLTLMERLRVVGMFAKGAFRPKSGGKDIEDEIADYNNDPEKALDELAAAFPTVREVLIDERDAYMADRIRAAMKTAGPAGGIAVVGDGHVPGMLRLLADLAPTAYRLPDVREGRLPRPDPDATASFDFTVRVGPDDHAGSPSEASEGSAHVP